MSVRRMLVANRGEIAVRIIKTCRDLGVETVLAASAADRHTLAARMADRTVVVGPAPATRSYLNHGLMVHAAVATGCDALHPGYGFLSERPELARTCEEAKIVFVGPTPDTIEQLGDKLRSRQLADEVGAPQIRGSGALSSVAEATKAAEEIGFPVLLKAAAGGGGKGMSVVHDHRELAAAYPRLVTEAREAFGDGTLFMEAFVETARHVEVQVLGDGRGAAWCLGVRDCSVQRRYQKVIEEAPAPALEEAARERITSSAVDLLARLSYRGVGTVEFLYDPGRGDVSFMEVNTRLQVEHPVTEQVTGLDLVALQLAVAAGEPVGPFALPASTRHAIEFRINAEDPANGFRPSPGRVDEWQPPAGPSVRLDTFIEPGTTVTPFYDSMIAKLIITGDDRDDSVQRARTALAEFGIGGIRTNLPLLRQIVADDDFARNDVHTRWLETDFLRRVAAA